MSTQHMNFSRAIFHQTVNITFLGETEIFVILIQSVRFSDFHELQGIKMNVTELSFSPFLEVPLLTFEIGQLDVPCIPKIQSRLFVLRKRKIFYRIPLTYNYFAFVFLLFKVLQSSTNSQRLIGSFSCVKFIFITILENFTIIMRNSLSQISVRSVSEMRFYI